ncbi:MAG: Mov34/MPN/PAD-1 family protein [Chloroflexota bacterium]
MGSVRYRVSPEKKVTAKPSKPSAKPAAKKSGEKSSQTVSQTKSAKADPEKPATKPEVVEASGNKPEEMAEAKPEPDSPASPKPAPATGRNSLDDVAAAITFPPPVKAVAVAKAAPKEDEKPHAPAIIRPSEARVRVAGERLESGTPSWAAVDILMDEPALRAMQAHALSSMDREVAGVMVGPHPEKQPDGRYLVHVIDSIAAKYTVMQGASVTYTADSWRYLNDTLGERYPDETGVMVGWYHTHPGFGIFLSGMDLFIHHNFFTQIWHTAYVLDPRARTSGFFCWSRDKSRVNRYDFGWPDWASGSW